MSPFQKNITSILFKILTVFFTTTAFCSAATTQVLLNIPAGGGLDQTFRIFQKYCDRKNIDVVPVYKPGAEGVIGLLALAEKNNKNVIAFTGTSAIPHLQQRNPDVELQYITLVSIPKFVLVSSKNSNIKNYNDLENKVKNNEKFTIGVGGPTALHLSTNLITNLNANDRKNQLIVPYTGVSMMLQNLLGGHVDVAFLTPALALKFIQTEKLNLLASTDLIEDIDTVLLSKKYKEWVNFNAYGMVMNVNADPEFVKYWSTVIQDFLLDPEVIKEFSTLHYTMPKFGPTPFKNLVKEGSKNLEIVHVK
jgi:tripartite-type tricarboxylate transporter receptor subunit TctC